MDDEFVRDPVRVNCASHHRPLFGEEFHELIDHAAACLKRLRRVIPFDALVGTGISGSVFGAALSYRLGSPLAIVRRAGESDRSCSDGGSHDTRDVVGYSMADRYVFVDDLIDSGRTFRRVVKLLAQRSATYAPGRGGGRVIAACLYHRDHMAGSPYEKDGFDVDGVSIPVFVF